MTRKQGLVALLLGAGFGGGLTISGMIQPQKVQDFLDVTDLTGSWDPSLCVVMGCALLVTLITYPVILRRTHPVLADKFYLPTTQTIDRPLVIGAALFGVGWGLGGFCPGPALVGVTTGSRAPILFVTAMLLGMALFHAYRRWTSSRQAAAH